MCLAATTIIATTQKRNGTVGPLGYYFYYDHRQQEGFREANSDYDLNGGSARLVWNVTNDSRFVLTLDAYDEEHGEPGGLRRREEVNPPNSVFVEDDRTASTRFFDRFRLERYYAMLEYQKFFSERTQLDIKAFGGYLTRWSKRQRGGAFGTLPSGPDANTNSIQLRSAYTEGLDARVRHDYDLFNDVSTIAGGIYFYHALQDRRDERGQTPDAEHGVLRNLNTGETWCHFCRESVPFRASFHCSRHAPGIPQSKCRRRSECLESSAFAGRF